MALYFLTYDLRGDHDYEPLYEELGRFNAVRILQSTWCFKCVNTDARGLREHFKGIVDAQDGLIVSEIRTWASFNTDGTPSDL